MRALVVWDVVGGTIGDEGLRVTEGANVVELAAPGGFKSVPIFEVDAKVIQEVTFPVPVKLAMPARYVRCMIRRPSGQVILDVWPPMLGCRRLLVDLGGRDFDDAVNDWSWALNREGGAE